MTVFSAAAAIIVTAGCQFYNMSRSMTTEDNSAAPWRAGFSELCGVFTSEMIRHHQNLRWRLSIFQSAVPYSGKTQICNCCPVWEGTMQECSCFLREYLEITATVKQTSVLTAVWLIATLWFDLWKRFTVFISLRLDALNAERRSRDKLVNDLSLGQGALQPSNLIKPSPTTVHHSVPSDFPTPFQALSLKHLMFLLKMHVLIIYIYIYIYIYKR